MRRAAVLLSRRLAGYCRVPAGRAREALAPYAALIALGAASALWLAPWRADFPLNDDWAYWLPARRLAEEGVLRLTHHTTATAVLQAAAGGLWEGLFGGGLGGLKGLTLLWQAAGVLLLLRLAREEGVAPWPAFTLAAAYWFCPLVLPQLVSFMSDLPYASLVIAALYAYARRLRGGGERWLAFGSVAAALAYLVRQPGLLLPLAMGAALGRAALERRTLALLAGPPLAALLAHQAWYHLVHGMTWAAAQEGVYRSVLLHAAEPLRLAGALALRLSAAPYYLALGAAPLLAGWVWAARVRGERRALVPAALWAGAAGWLAWTRGSFPYLLNTLHPTGIGTATLHGTEWKAAGIFAWPGLWPAVTAALFLGALALLGQAARLRRACLASPAARLFAWAAALQLAVPMLGLPYYDRYHIPVLPPLLLLVARALRAERFRPLPSAVALAALAGVSLAGTGDYLAWNAAKWRLGQAAVRRGIPVELIGGGHDWDGYWTYEPAMARLTAERSYADIGAWDWRGPRHWLMSLAPPERVPELESVLEEGYRTPLDSRGGMVRLYRLRSTP